MKPVILDAPMGKWRPVVYAKDQPQYFPLPAIHNDTGTVITCWRLTWRERLLVLLSGRLFLSVLTFNRPLQPVKLTTSFPAFAAIKAAQEPQEWVA